MPTVGFQNPVAAAAAEDLELLGVDFEEVLDPTCVLRVVDTVATFVVEGIETLALVLLEMRRVVLDPTALEGRSMFDPPGRPLNHGPGL